MSGKITQTYYKLDLKQAKEIIFDGNYTNPYNMDDTDEFLAALSDCTVEYTAIDEIDETDETDAADRINAADKNNSLGNEKATNISLSRMYHPDKYSYIGKALLSCCDRKFKLMVFGAKRFMLAETFEDGRNSGMTFPNDLRKSSRIMSVVTELLTGTEEKKLENMVTLRDTKNYGFRVNAMIKNNRPYVHAEWFDNTLQEYYQLEGFLGACRVSMSRDSLFMKSYLGKDYSKYYAKEDEKIFAAFESLEDAKQLSLQENDYEKQQIWEQRLSCLRKLEAEINRTVLGIMERRVFIGHSRDGISVEDLLHFYGLEKEFDCCTRNETMDIVLPNNHSDVKIHKLCISNFETLVPRRKSFKCTGNIEITIEDLYRALELGIEKARDICSLKERYGNLEKVFGR